jgi:hypothetical protein
LNLPSWTAAVLVWRVVGVSEGAVPDRR